MVSEDGRTLDPENMSERLKGTDVPYRPEKNHP